MATLLTAAAIALFATLFFMRRAALCVRRRHLGRAGAHTLSCGISGSILAMLAVVGISYLGYERLTAERIVASVEFARVAPYEYRARVMVDGERDQFFLLTGDEWQIDARIVSWQPPATILGLDPIYRLERLSGRYTDVDQERSEPRSVHSLSTRPLVDVWSVAREAPLLMPGVDAYYGTATYVPMADAARYDVSLSRDALIARPTNDAAREAVGAWR